MQCSALIIADPARSFARSLWTRDHNEACFRSYSKLPAGTTCHIIQAPMLRRCPIASDHRRPLRSLAGLRSAGRVPRAPGGECPDVPENYQGGPRQRELELEARMRTSLSGSRTPLGTNTLAGLHLPVASPDVAAGPPRARATAMARLPCARPGARARGPGPPGRASAFRSVACCTWRPWTARASGISLEGLLG